jgi:hypothetical protein
VEACERQGSLPLLGNAFSSTTENATVYPKSAAFFKALKRMRSEVSPLLLVLVNISVYKLVVIVNARVYVDKINFLHNFKRLACGKVAVKTVYLE